ncbi:hypothetical protein [Agrobacterium pusense]|uniref:hypothetical protein n=1 Tax=Agrobacterium pusense TaxID=648995 RepID=UPI0032DADE59
MVENPYPIPRQLRQSGILVGNGGDVYGPFDFKIFDPADVVVFACAANELRFTEVAGVTVTKVNGNTAMNPLDVFTVKFPYVVPVSTRYVVLSSRIAARAAGVMSGTRINPDALEKEFSKIATQQQELRRDIGRAVMVEFGDNAMVIDAGLRDGDTLMKQGGRFTAGPNLPDLAESLIAEAAAEADRAKLEADRSDFHANRSRREADRSALARDAARGYSVAAAGSAAAAAAAADVVGEVRIFDTYAAAAAALGAHQNNVIVRVLADETQDYVSTFYRIESGALVFKSYSVPKPMIFRQRDRVNLLDYATTLAQRSSLRNGNTAVNNAWADAINDAGGQGVSQIDVPAGDYEADTDTRLENPGFVVKGDGLKSVFRKNGQNSLFRTLGHLPIVGGGFPLTANVPLRSSVLQLAPGDAAELVPHRLYVLLDETAMFAGNTGKKGEFIRVREVSGGSVTIWGFTKLAYTSASGAKLVPITWTEGVGYQDIEIVGDTSSIVTSSNSWQELFQIDLRFCFRPQVKNVSIRDALHAGIFLHGCYKANIDIYEAKNFGSNTTGTDDPASNDGLPGFGYAIRESSINEGLIASGLAIEQCRGGYDTPSGYSDPTLLNYGEPTGSIISNGYHRDARGAAWGTHWSGYGIQFVNLAANGGRRNGITVRARSTFVDGFKAIDMRGPAVWLRGGNGSDPSLRGDYCCVKNVFATETNLGPDLESSIDWREMGAVVDEGWHNTVDGLEAVRNGGGVLSIGHNGIARKGVYRNLTGRDVCQLAVTTPDAVRIANANTQADILIDGLTVHSSDAKVRHLVSRETAATFDNAPIKVRTDNVSGSGYTNSKLRSATNDKGLLPESGTYAPLKIGTDTNVTSVIHLGAQFSRTGNTVTVSGKVTVNPAAAGAFITRFSLPVFSDFTDDSQLGGILRNSNGDVTAIVIADAANDCAYVTGTATVAGAKNCFYQFTYTIP